MNPAIAVSTLPLRAGGSSSSSPRTTRRRASADARRHPRELPGARIVVVSDCSTTARRSPHECRRRRRRPAVQPRLRRRGADRLQVRARTGLRVHHPDRRRRPARPEFGGRPVRARRARRGGRRDRLALHRHGELPDPAAAPPRHGVFGAIVTFVTRMASPIRLGLSGDELRACCASSPATTTRATSPTRTRSSCSCSPASACARFRS